MPEVLYPRSAPGLRSPSSSPMQPEEEGANPPANLPKLHTFQAKEVADEMTLLDAGLLRMIKTSELEDGVWMKKDKKEQLAPNIMVMVRSFNRVALLVPTEILEEETPQARAKVISAYIKIAQECYCHRNYNSLKAVLAGLQCTPIYRLNKTWKEVSSKKKRKFEQLSSVMHEDSNWSAYHLELDRHLKANNSFIPFLGVFLTTTAFYQTAAAAKQVEKRHKSVSFTSPKLTPERRVSSTEMYETYHLLEAITVRERLVKLRENSIAQETDGDDVTPRPRHISSPAINTRGHPTALTSPTRTIRDSPLCATVRSSKSESIIPVDMNSTNSSPRCRHQRGAVINHAPPPSGHMMTNGIHIDDESTPHHSGGSGSQRVNGSHVREETPRRGPREKRRLFASKKSSRSDGNYDNQCSITEDVCIELPGEEAEYRIVVKDSEFNPTEFKIIVPAESRLTVKSQQANPVPSRAAATSSSTGALTGFDRRRVWQAGKSREVSVSLSSSLAQVGGALTQTVGGSLECLLDAVEAELPSEREGRGERLVPVSLPRSPSLCALTSIDVRDGEIVALGLSDDEDDDRSTESGCESLENSDWTLQPPTLSLPLSLKTSSKSCENIAQESLGDNGGGSGRGLSAGRGVDLLRASGRGCGGGSVGMAGNGEVRVVAGDDNVEPSGSVESTRTEVSQSRFRRFPAFRQHRRNSSHPNFSFLKKGDDDPNSASTVNSPAQNHASSTTTSPTSKTVPPPPSTTGSLRKKVPSFLRAVSPRLSSSPMRKQRRRHVDDDLPRLQAARLERSDDPGDLLHQYQFVSLGCCAHLQGYELLRKVLNHRPHNTEAVNYKLSYQREPM